jgi:hypothetical protein
MIRKHGDIDVLEALESLVELEDLAAHIVPIPHPEPVVTIVAEHVQDDQDAKHGPYGRRNIANNESHTPTGVSMAVFPIAVVIIAHNHSQDVGCPDEPEYAAKDEVLGRLKHEGLALQPTEDRQEIHTRATRFSPLQRYAIKTDQAVRPKDIIHTIAVNATSIFRAV